MVSKEKITDTLSQLGITYRIVDHPAVFTVAESQAHLQDKRPIKNLLLKERGEGRKFLVIMDGNTRLDMKAIAESLGSSKLSFASADTMMQALGVTPGSVSPFGLLSDGSRGLEVVIDENLLGEVEIGFHPNDNTSTIFISGESLSKFIEFTGHKTHIVALSGGHE